MGRLNLPDSGRVYLDSNCVIYAVERIQPYAGLLAEVWEAVESGQIGVLTSELTLLETLVKPLLTIEKTM